MILACLLLCGTGVSLWNGKRAEKSVSNIDTGQKSSKTVSNIDTSLKDKNVVKLKIENYNRTPVGEEVLPEYKKISWTITLPSASAEQAGTISADMFNKLNSGLNGDITNALNEAKAYTDAAKTALNKLITNEAAARQAADKVIQDNLNAHIGNTSNPHKVTKAQLGLGNVQNLAPADMPVSTAQATAIADAKAAGTKAQTDLNTHANRRDNPHNVTRAQLGLATTDQVVFAKTTAASGFWKESDGRLKSQVENLNHTLDQICNIPTVHFKMNGKYQVGTIAQSLEEIEPLLVSENSIPASQVPNQSRFETFVGEDGQEYVKVKVVEYEMLSVMALEGVKLLRKEFEDFKKQLNNK